MPLEPFSFDMSKGKLPSILTHDAEPVVDNSRTEQFKISPPEALAQETGPALRRDTPPMQPQAASQLHTQRLHGVPDASPRAIPPMSGHGFFPISMQPQPQTAPALPSAPMPSYQRVDPRLPANLNAPNLKTYVQHIHHYTFNAPCTIYQSSDNPDESPIIYTDPSQVTYDRKEQRYSIHQGIAAEQQGREKQTSTPAHFATGHTTSGLHLQGVHSRFMRAKATKYHGRTGYTPTGSDLPASPPPGDMPASPPRTQVEFSSAKPTGTFPRDEVGVAEISTREKPDLEAIQPPTKRRARSSPAIREHDSSGPMPLPRHPLLSSPLRAVHQDRTAQPPLFPALAAPLVSTQRSPDLQTQNSSSWSDEVTRTPGNTNIIDPGAGTLHAAVQNTKQQDRGQRTGDQENLNDWELVVAMYTSGKGTADGKPLKSYSKGDGRKIDDRKLLEKRRTIGKTYESLGKERFERAIGYRIEEESGKRRKQKMYHVIARCRVVNAIRKTGGHLPENPDQLERLISHYIAQKAESRNAELSAGVSEPIQGSTQQQRHREGSQRAPILPPSRPAWTRQNPDH